MTETESTICLVFCDACVAAHAILNFQSVSPSSWSVFINTSPVSSEDCNKIMSAGIRTSLCNRTKSPTRNPRAGTSFDSILNASEEFRFNTSYNS